MDIKRNRQNILLVYKQCVSQVDKNSELFLFGNAVNFLFIQGDIDELFIKGKEAGGRFELWESLIDAEGIT